MIRAIVYFLVLVAAGAGLAWFANYHGDVVMVIAGQRIVMSVFHATCAFIAAVIILLFIWWIIKSIITAPFAFNRHLKNRKRDRGYQALSQGLIAVMSGDVANARKMLKQGNKLIDENKEPLILLLDAQTKQLEGDNKGAIEVYAKMRENPNMRLLGLKGLYAEALKSKAFDAAHQYAAEAAQLNASLKWANRATVEQLSLEGDWKEALSLFNTYEKAAKKNKTAANDQDLQHMRVVMMAGQAQEGFETYPDEAKRNALKAVKLEPNFVPAVNIATTILFKLDEVRKGSKMIEKLWSSTPHPDLALTYVNAYLGASALDRLKRAQNLARFNPKNHASLMIVARTALEAGEFELARKNALIIAKEAPTESTYLLLADIEAAQSGNEGKMREWLQMALHAEPDPVWIVDGMMVPQWVAISPISGQIGTCVWTQPTKNTHQNALDLDLSNDSTILQLEAVAQTSEPKTETKLNADKDDISKEVADIASADQAQPPANKPETSKAETIVVKTAKPSTTNTSTGKTSAANAGKPMAEEKPKVDTAPAAAIIIDAEPMDDKKFEDKSHPSFNRLNVDDPGVDPKDK
ncbi:heme biosynthesis protein HemY [Bartonella sp. HY761]|uniref:heme biosynthesis protein HemY n=1 Tax=Bartonella sp. HY761 TaxID=2979330 RepID=UPI00220FB01F|nr:heme biosynthesis HemY N-terminal domain-containing protein [Bartonella sp. HY761]UXN06818.1 hypothetical protein N6A79_02065 [Bartonella sp. HY761]